MRLYQLQNFGDILSFHKTYGDAADRIKELSPTSICKSTMQETKERGRTTYSNGYQIFAIDIDTDTEGIMNQLNAIVLQTKKTSIHF